MDTALSPEQWQSETWRALQLIVDAIDPIAHRDEPDDLEPVAALTDLALSVSETRASLRITFRKLGGDRRATLELGFVPDELIADVRAGGPSQGTETALD